MTAIMVLFLKGTNQAMCNRFNCGSGYLPDCPPPTLGEHNALL